MIDLKCVFMLQHYILKLAHKQGLNLLSLCNSDTDKSTVT